MSDMFEGGPLDLSGADTKGFDALPSGQYDAVVFDAVWAETKGGKMPAGQPMLKIQFKVVEPEYDNRRAFTQFVLPKEGATEKDKIAKMQGFFVRFLVALGYDEAKITGGKFKLDLEDIKGRECVITLGQQPDYNDPTIMQNTVRNIKAAGTKADSAPASALI